MITFSKAILCGHTTAAPRFRLVRGDRPVADFTVAVNEPFKRGEAWIERTTYIDVVCFGAFATAVKDLPKGTHLYIEGSHRSGSWDDQKTGQRRFKLQVEANKLRRVPRRRAEQTAIDQGPETAKA